MADFTQRISDALMWGHLRGCLEDDIDQTKSTDFTSVGLGAKQLLYAHISQPKTKNNSRKPRTGYSR